MRVLFLNPPVHHYMGQWFRLNPPLSLPILTAVVRAAGHEAEALDCEAMAFGPQAISKWKLNADVIGLTCLTPGAQGLRDTVAALRAGGFKGKVVVGGVHATVAAQEVAAIPGVDLVVTGECEGNVVELLEHATGIHAGEPAPIEAIPSPDWEHFAPRIEQYQGNAPHLTAGAEGIVMSTRGCPHACTFCGNSVFMRRRIRYRPVAAIAAEFEAQKRRGATQVFMYDDELVGHPMPDGWLQELADALEPIGLPWKTQGRCSRVHVTPEVCRLLVRAGCQAVMWGCESWSQKVLTAIRKGTRPEDNWHSLRTARAAGLRNFVFTMIGSQEEGDAEAAETCDALRSAYLEGLVQYRQTTVVTALPGTELWDVQHRDGWHHSTPNTGPQMAQIVHPTPWLSVERIEHWMGEYARACPVGVEG